MAAMGSNTELMIHRHLAGHTAKQVSEAVGLKLVANDEVTVDPKYLESLRNLAARGI